MLLFLYLFIFFIVLENSILHYSSQKSKIFDKTDWSCLSQKKIYIEDFPFDAAITLTHFINSTLVSHLALLKSYTLFLLLITRYFKKFSSSEIGSWYFRIVPVKEYSYSNVMISQINKLIFKTGIWFWRFVCVTEYIWIQIWQNLCWVNFWVL